MFRFTILTLTVALTLHGATAFAPRSRTPSSTFATGISVQESRLFEQKEESKTHAPGHEVRSSGPAPDISQEEQEKLQKQAQQFMEYQKSAAELDWPTQIRTLVQYNHGYGVMSTLSKEFDGHPSGSVVGFVPDEDGNPLFLFSGM
jgi:hypothetical protein